MVSEGLNLRLRDGILTKPREKWCLRRPWPLCPSDQGQQLDSCLRTEQLWESSRIRFSFSHTVNQKLPETNQPHKERRKTALCRPHRPISQRPERDPSPGKEKRSRRQAAPAFWGTTQRPGFKFTPSFRDRQISKTRTETRLLGRHLVARGRRACRRRVQPGLELRQALVTREERTRPSVSA